MSGTSRVSSASKPERVWFVSQRDPLEQTVRSMAAQLLEMGLPFVFDDAQRLPADLPTSRDEAAALLIDDPMLEGIDLDRLQRYKESGGRIFRLVDMLGHAGRDTAQLGLSARQLIDATTYNAANVLALHAPVTPQRELLRREQSRTAPQDMIATLVARAQDRLTGLDRFQEKAYQYWTVARFLIDAGYEHLMPLLGHSIEAAVSKAAVLSYHADGVGGLQQVFWYAGKSGRSDLMAWAIDRARELRRRRPRNGEVLAGTGLVDDPLGRNTSDPLDFRVIVDSYTHVFWTETVRYHGSIFAAMSDVTGETCFIEECEAIVDRLEQSHLRSDGLLAHTSTPDQSKSAADGRPVWARGVGHACYGLLSMLESLPAEAPLRARVQALLCRILEGLIAHQDPDSYLWRNVIDDPEARVETSGSLAFACVMYEGLRNGWLDEGTFAPVAEKAFQGLWQMHWHGGLAAHCRGTAAAPCSAYYLGRPQGWGVAPYLVMLILLRQAYLAQ